MTDMIIFRQYNISGNTPIFFQVLSKNEILFESAIQAPKEIECFVPDYLRNACKFAPSYKDITKKARAIAKMEEKRVNKEIIKL